jgi:sodium transport system ATP-binding protein
MFTAAVCILVIMNEILEVKGLTKTFIRSKKQQKLDHTDEKLKVAVKDLSFTCYRGEVFGLLGPNGAGKTTTLRILATLIKPDSGDALVEGRSLIREPQELRRRMGFLTGELKLEDFFTPSYLFDFFSSLHDVPPETARERKAVLFERFGVREFAQERMSGLSTGMKQKVSLLVSIVHDPDIIIFDEPTNGLDIITAKTVTDFLLDLKKQGKTVIVSTHIFSLVEKICDRVGIIMNGEMAACDGLENITAQKSLEDKFFEIYEDISGKKTGINNEQ